MVTQRTLVITFLGELYTWTALENTCKVHPLDSCIESNPSPSQKQKRTKLSTMKQLCSTGLFLKQEAEKFFYVTICSHMAIKIYIYWYMCVCVCVYIYILCRYKLLHRCKNNLFDIIFVWYVFYLYFYALSCVFLYIEIQFCVICVSWKRINMLY